MSDSRSCTSKSTVGTGALACGARFETKACASENAASNERCKAWEFKQNMLLEIFRATTAADPSHVPAKNILDRDFTASKPDERWVTDITYVWTEEGWCYLAAILDLFSRRVVGWALDATLSTSLPLAALDMALQRRGPTAGLLHHSDRGCQYTSSDYRAALASVGAVASMSRKGNCWDNAVAESFFATLKTELVHRKRWATRIELRAAVFEYIESFYNRRRLHSTLGYKTPAQFEMEHRLDRAA